MLNVLVTGGTGFVGAYLIQALLQRGYRVFALRRDNSPEDLVKPFVHRVEWIEADLLDLPALDAALCGIDHVYHTAAMVSFDPADAQRMETVNVEGTANLVDAALKQGVSKFLHVSSIAALGRKEHQQVIDENSVWENNKENSRYAQSKFKAECVVWRGMEEGLRAVVVNPGLIFGAGFWNRGTGEMLQKIHQGLSYYPLGASCLVDVRDLAEICCLLMERDIDTERFVVCSENLSFERLFATLAKGLQRPAPHKPLSDWLSALAWRAEWLRSKLLGRSPIVTQETLRNARNRYEYRNDKLLAALPDFSFRPAEQTLLETAQAFVTAQSQGQRSSFWNSQEA